MPISSLSQITGTNGFRYAGASAGDFTGYSVSGVGDINGDGFADLMAGAPRASGSNPVGFSYVIFGGAAGHAANGSLGSLADNFLVRRVGVAGDDRAGFAVGGGGDINGDGYADMLVGAPLTDPGGKTNGGSSYVTYGKSTWPASASLGSLTVGIGARLDGGSTTVDNLGSSVAHAGDVNGDGYADMLFGAWTADPNGLSDAGSTYLVFGSGSSLPATIDLSTMASGVGVRFVGAAAGDRAGSDVSSAGDFNGDGFDDLLIGAQYADGAGSNAGAAYVVFGRAAGFTGSLTLSTLDGTQGFALLGEAEGYRTGIQVSSAGDFNGDGLDDLVVGSAFASGNKGAIYVVYGRRDPMPATLSLAALDGSNGFRVDGSVAFDAFGRALDAAGDFNADGFDDIVVGARGRDLGATDTGAAYILFGASSGFAADATIDALSGSQVAAIYGAAGERAGFSVAGAGDVNGDGYGDVAIGTMDSSGSGSVSVVYGEQMPGGGIHLQTNSDDTLTLADDGVSVLFGGRGQDRLILPSTAFRMIDGGGDRDTLALSGSGMVLDLTTLPHNRVRSIEQIELTGTGRNKLVLSPRDLLALSENSNTLRVDGNADDVVGWTGSGVAGATIQIASQFYRTYTEGAATLLVDTDITMIPREIPLASLTAGQGLRLNGSSAFSYAGHSVSGAGDVNGDGFDDVIIGAYGRAGPGNSGNAKFGAAYVVFGSGSGLPAQIDLDSLDGANGYRIRGSVVGEELGIAVSGVGDINGDGLDDLLIANNPTARPSSPTNFAAYIVYGKTGSYPVEVDAATLSVGSGAVRGHKIVDLTAPYLVPSAVAGLGDTNGDGLDDMAIGVGGAGPSNSSNGRTYAILGSKGLATDTLSLGSVGSVALKGADVGGALAGDLAGAAVGSAGDVNGDGYDDLIVGAYRSDASITDAGAAYVVFGGPSALSNQTIDLGTMLPVIGFRLTGENTMDYTGKSVSRAGDVNGDGFGDLLVGGYQAGAGGVRSGAAYLVFGRASGFGTNVNLGELDGTTGVRLAGANDYDYAGVSVAAAGDVNGDGFDDMLVGAFLADANGSNSGATYLVYGKASGWSPTLSLGALSGVDGIRIAGADTLDRAGRSVQGAGDINGDGFDDLVVGAYLADVGGLEKAGSAYVIYGGDFNFTVTHPGTTVADALSGGVDIDRMVGGLGNDTLLGLQGADALRGGAGNDLLRGGPGADLLDGGSGQDTADYSDSGGDVWVDLFRGLGQVGDAQGDRLRNVEHVIGSAKGDLLVGDGAPNRLQGGAGNDSLRGALGNDTLEGGSGFDTAVFSAARAGYTLTRNGTQVIVSGADGTDQLDGMERLQFADQSVFLGVRDNDVNGDAISDVLWRNMSSGSNVAWRSASSATPQAVTWIADVAWKNLGTGDFDGDAIADILWRNGATGANAIWKSANSATTQAMSSVGDLSFKVVGIGDFNGDGSADILWRNTTTGTNVIWRSGNSATAQAVVAVGDLNWKVAGIGDFNGDGTSDILWRNSSTGVNTVWRGADSAQAQAVSSVGDLNFQVAGIGDFTGDGASDILWRNSSTGVNIIWRSADSTQVQAVSSVGDPANWKLAGTGDYNGDGTSDLLWRNASTGANAIWNSANSATGQAVSNVADTNWVIQSQTNTWSVDSARTAYDFDGDGKSDLLWRNDASGANAIWKNASSSNGQFVSNVGDLTWKVAGIGDFDGDAKADILWRNATTGINTIWKSANSATPQAVTSIGDLNWKMAGIGDFNGDGKDDILWRNTSTGTNAIWGGASSSASGLAVSAVGDLNWKVAGVGDFNGDGKDDILWRNTSTGANTIWRSASSATSQAVTGVGDQNWKVAGVADFNGDGTDDILWRNASTGQNAIWGGGSSSSGQAISSVGDLNFQVAGTGDYNGDGKADVLWRNATTGTNIIWSAGSSASVIAVTGVAGAAWAVQDEAGTWLNTAHAYAV